MLSAGYRFHDNGRTIHRRWILFSENEGVAIAAGMRERRRDGQEERARAGGRYIAGFLREKFNFTKISVW